MLVLEKIGLINEELLVTIDLILRRLGENDIIFGGVLIIATGDTNQLPNKTSNI